MVDDVLLNSNLFVGKDVSFNSKLFVSGDVSLNSNLNVGGTLTVNDIIPIGNRLADIGDSTHWFKNLYVYDLIVGPDSITIGDSKITSSEGTINIPGDFKIDETFSVYGDVSFGANLIVHQKTILQNDVSMNNKLTVSNDVLMNSKLVVSGDVSMNSQLSVAGNVTMNKTLFVSNIEADNFSIKGTMTYINVSQLDISDNLIRLNKNGIHVAGSGIEIELADAPDKIGAFVKLDNTDKWTIMSPGQTPDYIVTKTRVDIIDASLIEVRARLEQYSYNLTDTTSIDRNVVLSNTGYKLSVLGDASLNANLFVNGDVSFNGKITVRSDVSLNSKLFVNGDVSFNSRLMVNSDASFNGRLFVNGDVSFNSRLMVNSDVSLNSKLFVTDDVTMNRRLLVAGSDSSFNGNLCIGQTLSVANKAAIGMPPANDLYELDLSGQMRIYETVGSAASTTTGSLIFEHADASGTSSIVFKSKNAPASDYAYIQYQENVGGTGSAAEKGLLTIGVENDPSSANVMDRISIFTAGGAGYVGINTKNPLYNFDVNGSSNLGNLISNNFIGGNTNLSSPVDAIHPAFSSQIVSNTVDVSLGNHMPTFYNGVYEFSASSFNNSGSDGPAFRAFDRVSGNCWYSSVIGDVGPTGISNNQPAYSPVSPYLYQGGIAGDTANNFFKTVVGTQTICGEWLQVKLPYAFSLKSYKIFYDSDNINTAQALMPEVFYIVGSNNGSTWAVVDYKTNEQGDGGFFNSYSLTTKSANYTYFRLIITNLNGSTGNIRIGDFILSGYPSTYVIGKTTIGNDLQLYGKLITTTAQVAGNFVYENRPSQNYQDASFNSMKGYYALDHKKAPVVNYEHAKQAVSIWSPRYNPGVEISKVCWSSKLLIFCAVGSTNSYISSDGVSWTFSLIQAGITYTDVCWSNELNIFCAVGQSGIANSTNLIATSPDGIVWTVQTHPAVSSSIGLTSIEWSPEYRIFNAVGYFNTNGFQTSYNGISWSAKGSPGNATSVVWTNALKKFIIINNIGGIANGTNQGTDYEYLYNTWSNENQLVWSEQLGMVVAYSGSNIYTSYDGLEWSIIENLTTVAPCACCWAAELGMFCLIDGDKKCYTSSNGLDWTFIRTITEYSGTIGGKSLCWSPELSIFCLGPSSGDSFLTSSLKTRIPTGYNTFNHTFNRIDENGNWTFDKNVKINGNIEFQNAKITDIGTISSNLNIGGNIAVPITTQLSAISVDVSNQIINTSVYITGILPSFYNGQYTFLSSSNIQTSHNVFDNSESTAWTSNSTLEPFAATNSFNNSITKTAVENVGDVSGAWVQVSLPYRFNLKNYQISNYSGNINFSPAEVFIVGSNDNLLWHLVDTSSNNGIPNNTTANFAVSNANYYTTYRLIVKRTRGSSRCIVSSLSLFGYPLIGTTLVGNDFKTFGNAFFYKDVSLNTKLRVGGDVSMNKNVDISGMLNVLTHFKLPVGGTNLRPDVINEAVSAGYIRYNSDNSQFEGYGPGDSWGSLGGVINVAQNTKIVAFSPEPDSSNNELQFFTAPTASILSGDAVERMRIMANGDISMNNSLFVGDDVSFNSKLFVVGDVSMNSKLIVGNDVSFNSKLWVGTTTNLVGDVSMNSKLIVGNDVSLNSKLWVGTTTNLVGDVSMNSKLIVGNDVSFNSNLYVATTTNLVGDVSMNSKLIVGNDVSFNSKLWVGTTTNLVGDVSLNSKLIVGNDVSFNSKLYVATTTNLVGDVSMNSKLIVGSDVSLNSKLWVATTTNLVGDVSLNSKLIVGNDVSFNSKLYVETTTNLVGDVSLNSKLIVGNDVSFNRKLWVATTTNLVGDVSMNSKLIVGNDVSFNSKLYVATTTNLVGDVSLNSKLIVGNDVSFNSKLWVATTTNLVGDVSLNSKLIVGNDVSFNSKLWVATTTNLVGDVSLNSKLIVGDDVSFNSKLWVGRTTNLVGDVSMNSKLIVGNDVSLNSKLYVATTTNLVGDVSLNSKLIVGDDVSFNSKLYVETTTNLVGDVSLNSKLIVGNDVSLNSKLWVATTTNLVGDVSMNSKLIVGNDVSFNSKLWVGTTTNLVGDVSMNSKLIVGNDVSFNSKLWVATTTNLVGDVSMNSKLIVGNDVSFNSKLWVGRTTNLVGDVSMNSKLIVGNDVSFNSKLYVATTTNLVGDVSMNSKLIVGNDVSLNSKLWVGTTTNLVGDVSMNSKLIVGNDVSFNSKLFIAGDVSLNSKLIIGDDISLNSKLYVAKTTNLVGDVSMNSKLIVGNDVSFNSKLWVATTTNLVGDVSLNSKLIVGNDASFNSKLWVATTTNLVGDVSMNSKLIVGNDVSFNSKLFVVGDVSMNSNLIVGNDVSFNSKLFVVGDVSMNSKLIVGNDVSFNSKLFVVGDVSMNSKLIVGNDVSLNSKLYVATSTNLVGDVSLNSKLIVGNDVSFNSKLFVATTTNLVGDVSLNSKLIVGNDVSFNSKLFVVGDVSMNSKLIVGNDVSLNSKLFVFGDVSMNRKLIVGNDVSFNSKLYVATTTNLVGDVSMNSKLIVGNDVSFNSKLYVATTTNLVGDVSMNSKLIVGNDVSFNSKLYVATTTNLVGDVSMNSKLIVGNDVSFNSKLYVATTTNLVGDVSLNSKLIVGNDVSFNSKLWVGTTTNLVGDVSMNSKLIVGNDISFNSKLFVMGDVSMNSGLSVASDVSFNNKLMVSNDVSFNSKLSVANDVSFNGLFDVDGISHFKSNMYIDEQLLVLQDSSFNGNLHIGEYLKYKDNLVYGLHSNSYYANDNVVDIQVALDKSGAEQGIALFVSSGSYGGSDLLITDRQNIGIIAPDAGSTITELPGTRGIVISGATSTRIRMTSLQVKGMTTINGTLGRHYFANMDFAGGFALTGSTTNYITFNNCSFGTSFTVPNTFAGVVYLINCDFGGLSLTLNNLYSSQQVILNNCIGLASYPNVSKSTLFGLNSLSTGASHFVVGNITASNDVSFNSKLFVGTTSNFVGDVSMNSKLIVGNDVSFNKKLFVVGDVSMNSKLVVGSDVSFNSKLYVSSDVSFNSKFYVTGDVSLNNNVDISGTLNVLTHFKLPVGGTNQRPNVVSEAVSAGYVRYNTDNSQFEGYGPGDSWGSLGGVINVAQNTKIVASYPEPDSSNNELQFFTAPTASILSGDAVERMRILANGDISMNNKLSVAGDVSLNSMLDVANTLTMTNDASIVLPAESLSNITYPDSTQQVSAYTGAGLLAGTYNNASITIDNQGRIIAISSGIYYGLPYYQATTTISNTYSPVIKLGFSNYNIWNENVFSTFKVSISVVYGTNLANTYNINCYVNIYPYRLVSASQTSLITQSNDLQTNAINGNSSFLYNHATYAPNGRYFWAHGIISTGTIYGGYVQIVILAGGYWGIQIKNPSPGNPCMISMSVEQMNRAIGGTMSLENLSGYMTNYNQGFGPVLRTGYLGLPFYQASTIISTAYSDAINLGLSNYSSWPPNAFSTFKVSISVVHGTNFVSIYSLDCYLNIYPYRLVSATQTPLNTQINNLESNAINGNSDFLYTNSTYAPNGRYFWAHGIVSTGSMYGGYVQLVISSGGHWGFEIKNPNVGSSCIINMTVEQVNQAIGGTMTLGNIPFGYNYYTQGLGSFQGGIFSELPFYQASTTIVTAYNAPINLGWSNYSSWNSNIFSTFKVSISVIHGTSLANIYTLDCYLNIYPYRLVSATQTPLNAQINNMESNAINGNESLSYVDPTYAPRGRYFWAHEIKSVGSMNGGYVQMVISSGGYWGFQIKNPNVGNSCIISISVEQTNRAIGGTMSLETIPFGYEYYTQGFN